LSDVKTLENGFVAELIFDCKPASIDRYQNPYGGTVHSGRIWGCKLYMKLVPSGEGWAITDVKPALNEIG